MKGLKRIFVFMAALVLLSVPVWAADVDVQAMKSGYVGPLTLHNQATPQYGDSDVYILPSPVQRFTWTVAISNVVSTTSITLKGSIDGTVWDTLDTSTAVATQSIRHVVNKPVRYIKSNVGNVHSLHSGTPTVTVKFLGLID
jgi:hypothetical protein